jgi:hypothetical protein
MGMIMLMKKPLLLGLAGAVEHDISKNQPITT